MVSGEEFPLNFFEHIDDVKNKIAEGIVIFFIDYDGTLTPIVDTPDLAILSDATRQTLINLSSQYQVAVVSGRSTGDVMSKVDIDGIYYAGSHGFEIVAPDGERERKKEAEEIFVVINEVHKVLSEKLSGIKGALVENVKFTVTAHYRLVAQEEWPRFEEIVDDVLKEFPSLKKSSGKCVFELKPNLDWNKGKAVDWIWNQIDEGKNAIPLYIGDDTTDEDAFAVVKDTGFAIGVMEEPKNTLADYYVRDPDEVKKLLETFLS